VAAHVDNQETRLRLLVAAGEVFAERGFRHATVREICRRAGANIAAVNYHFGDKERLYAHVLRYAHQAIDRQLTNPPPGSRDDPREELREFIRGLMLQIFDQSKLSWLPRIMAREMVDPTPALGGLVPDLIRPRADYLEAIVRRILGRGATPRDVSLCAFSVIAQCIFYRHSHAVMSQLHPELTFAPQQIRRVADHIARFCIAAMENWRRSRP